MNQGIHMTRVYMGTDSHSVTGDMTLTHATVRHLTSRVEGLGHKLFMDNFFSSPRLFDENTFMRESTAQQKRHAL